MRPKNKVLLLTRETNFASRLRLVLRVCCSYDVVQEASLDIVKDPQFRAVVVVNDEALIPWWEGVVPVVSILPRQATATTDRADFTCRTHDMAGIRESLRQACARKPGPKAGAA